MLLGRVGLWMMKPPFTKYAQNGLMGEIVGTTFIQDAVSKGRDVNNDTYLPVEGGSLYSADLAQNCIIVMIEAKGKYYYVPDKYISNLYDGQQHFLNHYITVRVGLLPKEYDMTEVARTLAKTVTEVTGIDVLPKDVYVGVSDRGGMILTDEESLYENLRRMNLVGTTESIFNKYDKSQDKIKDLESKLDSVSEKYLEMFD